MMQQPDFAELLSQHIAASTLSLRRLSERAGVPKTTIVNWQSGSARRPQLWQRVVRVAAALELDEARASALLVAAGLPPLAALQQMALVKEDRAALRRWSQPPQENTETRTAMHTAMHTGHMMAGPGDEGRGRELDQEAGLHDGLQVGLQRVIHNQRHRHIMLEKVRSFWIEGILARSLQGATALPLNLEYRPELVGQPWYSRVPSPDEQDCCFSQNRSIVEVYDHYGGSFLLLGEAGCGKTTTLLELCRALLERARQVDSYPLPVVFRLSSWAGSGGAALEEWLLEELKVRYQVPLAVAQGWLAADELLLLLDGLDEVPTEMYEEPHEGARNACVAAINRFREQHLVNVVVCSRANEYIALDNRLVLPGAVYQKPLDAVQLEPSLLALGRQLANVSAEVDQLRRRLAILSALALSSGSAYTADHRVEGDCPPGTSDPTKADNRHSFALRTRSKQKIDLRRTVTR